jgi:O-phosphoseryl-tRNA(Cys) synthetase
MITLKESIADKIFNSGKDRRAAVGTATTALKQIESLIKDYEKGKLTGDQFADIVSKRVKKDVTVGLQMLGKFGKE